jgi:thiamine-monophosphate kinase
VQPKADGQEAALAAGARVGDLGELALIERINRRVGSPPRRVVIGIGDDTAAVRLTAGTLALMTTDAMVEDVHFRRRSSSAADVGWKALAINASDIASMGGAPTAAMVSLVLPPTLEARWVDDLYEGLIEAARAFDIAIVGGNLAQGPSIVIDVGLLGEVAEDRVISRAHARPGDLVAVTGTLGRAAAGLIALEHDSLPAVGSEAASAIQAQRRPQPRLAAGRALAASGAVRAMIDLSDGLALDLSRLCDASAVGVRIDATRLPIDAAVQTVARFAGRDLVDLAIAGGEDYELLFAIPPEAERQVMDALAAVEVSATVIGTMLSSEHGRTIVVDGAEVPLEARGWTHFGG